MEKTVSIEKKMLEIEERGVKLRLTIVDTPGFGDAVNNEDCWQPVEGFVDSQFEQYFKVYVIIVTIVLVVVFVVLVVGCYCCFPLTTKTAGSL